MATLPFLLGGIAALKDMVDYKGKFAVLPVACYTDYVVCGYIYFKRYLEGLRLISLHRAAEVDAGRPDVCPHAARILR